MIDIDISKKLFGDNGVMNLLVQATIQKGEFISLMGSSGSGKTTLLRVLAGLEEAEGKIVVDGKIWLDNNKSIKPQKRDIGFVFQDYALFENMSVEENLLFVEKDLKLAKQLLEVTDSISFRERSVKNLSGGQKQRVALCRAMMNRPKLLLMDEPLSALDKERREKVGSVIKEFHNLFNATTIMVTHDAKETITLSDRVITLDSGNIASDMDPYLLFDNHGSHMAEVLHVERKEDSMIAKIWIANGVSEIITKEKVEIGDIIKINLNILN